MVSLSVCVGVCPSVCVSQTVWSQSGVTVWAEINWIYPPTE